MDTVSLEDPTVSDSQDLIEQPVNNDDFLSRYRLLRFGRQKVLEHLGNSTNFRENPHSYF